MFFTKVASHRPTFEKANGKLILIHADKMLMRGGELAIGADVPVELQRQRFVSDQCSVNLSCPGITTRANRSTVRSSLYEWLAADGV